MLDSRYLYLHEALGLGPMWLAQTARLLPIQPISVQTVTAKQPAPPCEPVQTCASAIQNPVTKTTIHQSHPNHHRAALQHIIRQPPHAASETTTITQNEERQTFSSHSTIDDLTLSYEAISAALAICTRCNLHQERCTPLYGYGATNARLLVISSNPAPPDDSSQQLFSGEVGKLLSNMLAAINISTEEVFYTSQVKCAPNVSLKVTSEQLQACLPYLSAQIKHIQPRAILLLGQTFSRLDQSALAQNLHNIPYVISPHPARLLRQSQLKASAWTALKQLHKYLHKLT